MDNLFRIIKIRKRHRGFSLRKGGNDMFTIIAVMLLLIYGMPFFGIRIMMDKENRTLGAAVFVVGIIIWAVFGIFSR